jgi:hypothetical protein
MNVARLFCAGCGTWIDLKQAGALDVAAAAQTFAARGWRVAIYDAEACLCPRCAQDAPEPPRATLHPAPNGIAVVEAPRARLIAMPATEIASAIVPPQERARPIAPPPPWIILPTVALALISWGNALRAVPFWQRAHD